MIYCENCKHIKLEGEIVPEADIKQMVNNPKQYTQYICTLYPKWAIVSKTHYCGMAEKRK